MVWLAAFGSIGPITSTRSPVATPTIGGISWKLYKGPNGKTTVFSFVAASQVNDFTGDLKLFLTYLATSQSFSASQYVKSIGAGTEPFTGSNAVLNVTAYNIVINLGSGNVTGNSTTKGSKTTTAKGSSGTGAAVYGQCGKKSSRWKTNVDAAS